MRIDIGKIKTDYEGFARIVEISEQIKSAESAPCEIEMQNWIDANMCAPLGAIFQKRIAQGVNLSFSHISTKLKELLQRNHFLSYFSSSEKTNAYGTSIEYNQFKAFEQFRTYVIKHFRSGSRGLPEMTPELLKRFRSSLFEIFFNAVEHSYTTDDIIACGQRFPSPYKHTLNFTIVDLGIGIDGNIKKKLGVDLSSEKAIRWALSGKTTRRLRSGGLGLELIQQFVNLNGGELIIVSGNGYISFKESKINSQVLPLRFPGTAVTISIDTADTKSYCLESEIDPSDIF